MLHEDLVRDHEVVGSSDRSFGLTIAAVCGFVGAVRMALGHEHWGWWLAVALIAATLALFRPRALAPLNVLWLRLGLLLYKVVNPIAMGLVFFMTVVPIGLIMRACGKDTLRLRRDPDTASYWIVRDPPGPEASTMKNQF
jgi:hypothetical protein